MQKFAFWYAFSLAEAGFFDEPRIGVVKIPLWKNKIGMHLLIQKWRCATLCHLNPKGEEEPCRPETSHVVVISYRSES